MHFKIENELSLSTKALLQSVHPLSPIVSAGPLHPKHGKAHGKHSFFSMSR